MANRLVKQLRTYYKDSDIICISDGTWCNMFEHLCSCHKIHYIRGERLKLMHHGGAFIKRFMSGYLEHSSSDILIRLEPDSFIRYAFNKIPSTDIAANLVTLKNGHRLIMGGCTAFKRSAVEKIIDSELLDEEKYKSHNFAYNRYAPPYLMHGEEFTPEFLSATDVIWTDVINRLGLSVQKWDEVYCRVRDKCPKPEKYAVVHPVKEISCG